MNDVEAICQKLEEWLAYDKGPRNVLIPRELADRAITALRREAWQPIETAPLDADVLVCAPNWSSGGEARHWPDEGWYVAGNAPSDSWGSQIYPSHWKPLPPPPAALGEGVAGSAGGDHV